MGGNSGSRASTEPVPVSALSGFDPGREIVQILHDYRNIASRDFYAIHAEFVACRDSYRAKGASKTEAMIDALIEYAERAIDGATQ